MNQRKHPLTVLLYKGVLENMLVKINKVKYFLFANQLVSYQWILEIR